MKFVVEYKYTENGNMHRGSLVLEDESEEDTINGFRAACQRAEAEIEFYKQNWKHLVPKGNTVKAQNQAKRNQADFLSTLGKKSLDEVGLIAFRDLRVHINDLVGFYTLDGWFAAKQKEQDSQE